MKTLDQLTVEELKKVQKRLNDAGFNAGPVDGDLGPKTKAAWNAACIGDFSSFSAADVKKIQTKLAADGFYTTAIDGIPGPRTRSAWREAGYVDAALKEMGIDLQDDPTDPRLEELPPGNPVYDDPMSPSATELILYSEGLDQPGRWPGGASGITLGIGYDLGYHKESEFRKDWGPYIAAGQRDRLATAIGKTGTTAKNMASRFSDIKVSLENAKKVFSTATLPKYEDQTEKAFPGMNVMPADAEGGLVSLVFNRGPSVTGDRRREMAEIKRLIGAYKGTDKASLLKLQKAIATEIRKMKRLWVGKGLDGLLTRRENEAKLIERAV